MANRFDFLKTPQINAPQFLTGKEPLLQSKERALAEKKIITVPQFVKDLFPGIVAAKQAVEQKSFEPLKEYGATLKEKFTPEHITKEDILQGKFINKKNMLIAAELATGFVGSVEKKAAKVVIEVADTALLRLRNAIKEAGPARAELKTLQSAALSKKAGAATEALATARGESAFIKAKGALKGELVPEAQKPRFEGLRAEPITQITSETGKIADPKEISTLFRREIKEMQDSFKYKIGYDREQGLSQIGHMEDLSKRLDAGDLLSIDKPDERLLESRGYNTQRIAPEGKLTKADIETLSNMINDTPYITTFEKVNAWDGLNDILRGEIPQPKKLSLLEDVFGRDLVDDVLKHRTALEKLNQFGLNLAGLPKAIKSSFDLSFGGRQGIFAAPKYRKEFWDSWKKQFGAFGSEKAAAKIAKEIADSPDYLLARESGVSFTKLGADIAEREERFASAWGDKLPIIKQSSRAYNAFANKFRNDIFASMARDARAIGLNPNTDKELAKQMANLTNIITGRGPLGDLEGVAKWLNVALFSPRLLSSRLNLVFNPKLYLGGDPFVRKQALRALLGYGSFVTTVLTVAALAGAEVETNSNSADFAKIKVGNTRFEITGGLQQYIRIASQLITGKYISTTTGKEITLGEGYKPITRFDILLRQLESKESPIFSFVSDLLKQQTPTGEPVKVTDEMIQLFMPMIIQDFTDIAKDNPDLLPWAALGIFGVGVQTYKSRKQNNKFNFLN